jgi:hypothetical protein
MDEIESSLRSYIATSLSSDCQADDDVPALHAVRSPDLSGEQRVNDVTAWLRTRYHALMHFNSEQGRTVAGAIIAFAEEHPNSAIELGTEETLRLFAELESALGDIAPRNYDGSGRDVTSLTSKALWLCFPESIPMFDAYAASALSVLRRLLRLPSAKSSKGYPAFIETWKLAYAKLMPEERELPCDRVRAFDRWLGYLGRPGFD